MVVIKILFNGWDVFDGFVVEVELEYSFDGLWWKVLV